MVICDKQKTWGKAEGIPYLIDVENNLINNPKEKANVLNNQLSKVFLKPQVWNEQWKQWKKKMSIMHHD